MLEASAPSVHSPRGPRTRRSIPRVAGLLAVCLATIGLAACGGGPGQSDGEAGTSGRDTRSIETSAGPVEVPRVVERVVTTHNIATQPLIDLGVRPVGIGALQRPAAYPDYWSTIEAIPQVANAQAEVELEEVADLRPDLIFAINTSDEATIDKLGKIAPVIQIGIDGPERSQWRERAALVAQAVGREDRLQSLDRAYEKRAAQIAASHRAVLGSTTFSVLESFEDGAVTPYSPSSMVGAVLAPTGVQFSTSARSARVRAVDDMSGSQRGFSFENLPELTDGDAVLHGSSPSTGRPTPPQAAMLSSPLFRQTPAARTGRVLPIGKTLIAGYGDAMAALELFESGLEQLEQR